MSNTVRSLAMPRECKTSKCSVKRVVFYALAVFLVVSGFYALSAGRLILNGSTSLPHNAYLMVSWPKWVFDGAYVALELPEALKAKFDGLVLVKQVRGLPGDHLVSEHGTTCISDFCVPHELKPGQPVLKPTPSTRIKPGQIAAFGSSPSSLDSRYEIIGLFQRSDIIAVGFPIRFPHWTEVRAWLDS